MDARILEDLFALVLDRKGGDPEASYTARLFAKGTRKIAQKVGEEGVETALAAVTEGSKGVIGESADLLYHLLVLWAETGVVPADVWEELNRRQGMSGIAEKKSRSQK